MSRSAGPERKEGGQATVMIIGFVVVLAMMVVVVLDAWAAYLRRQSLSSLADGAALSAADGIEGEQVYTDGLGEHGVVDPQRARARRELPVIRGRGRTVSRAQHRCGHFGGPCGGAPGSPLEPAASPARHGRNPSYHGGIRLGRRNQRIDSPNR